MNPWGALIGAAIGAGKSELVDKPNEERQRAYAAKTIRLSPWTGMSKEGAQNSIQEANLGNSMMQGAMAGSGVGGGGGGGGMGDMIGASNGSSPSGDMSLSQGSGMANDKGSFGLGAEGPMQDPNAYPQQPQVIQPQQTAYQQPQPVNPNRPWGQMGSFNNGYFPQKNPSAYGG